MAAAFGGLRSAFAGISPRERRLLTILGAVIGGLGLVAVVFFSSIALDDLETERAQAVDALRTIRNERPRIRQRQERRESMLARYRTHPEPKSMAIGSGDHGRRATGVLSRRPVNARNVVGIGKDDG